MNYIVGLDFSLTCPCLCLCVASDTFSFPVCKFFYLTSVRKFERFTGNIIGEPHRPYNSQEERFDQISNWVLTKIPENSIIYLEGYSFGSHMSRLFDIGECTGLVKHKLWKNNISFQLVPPTVVKKFASGKGNSNKEKMYDAFIKETNFNLLEELNTRVGTNPQSDIVDAFYLAKYGHTKNCV